MLKVALKYCGGCNPDYDRVSAAETIQRRLNGRVDFVSADSCDDIDIVLVLAGCESACTDISAFEDCETVFIRSVREAERNVAAILRRIS